LRNYIQVNLEWLFFVIFFLFDTHIQVPKYLFTYLLDGREELLLDEVVNLFTDQSLIDLGVIVHEACGLNCGTINTEGIVVQQLLVQIGGEGGVYNACCLCEIRPGLRCLSLTSAVTSSNFILAKLETMDPMKPVSIPKILTKISLKLTWSVSPLSQRL